MDCPSDTESDSPGPSPSDIVKRSTKDSGAFHEANTNLDVGLLSFGAVRNAIETLSEQVVPSILADKPRFLESSELLLQFLDHVPHFLGTDDAPEVIQIFALLGSHFFLQRLLEFRKFIRLAEQAPGPQSIIITWIDVVLAKLSVLATPIAIGSATYDAEEVVEWIQLRREDDAIRAATQLPDTWKAMVAVMGSSNFSPAARRLTTSICFISYVMVRQITSEKIWPREGPPPLEILHSLYLSINQSTCAPLSPSVLGGSPLDIVQLAMFVSLFASAHPHIEPGDITYSCHLRPEGFGHILEIIQIIWDQSSSLLCVLEKPDPAQSILLRWGNVVPWSWSTWNDQRVANTESLRSLSATWFFLIHPPMQDTGYQMLERIRGIDLKCTLLSDVLSSSLMVLQLLREILDERNRNLIPRRITTRILCKLCWASVQYLETHILDEIPQFGELIPELCNSLILLFPVMKDGVESEDNLVKFMIVEALSLVPVKVISSSLKKILQTKQFLTDLEESMRCCITLVSDQDSEGRDQDIQTHFARVLLNFSSLLLQSAIDDPSLRRTISSFVVFVSQSMLGKTNRFMNIVILGPFLTILSILQNRIPETIGISDEDIWSLTIQGLNQHLSIPAAFASYLLTTASQHRDSLLRHEAWNYLLDVLTKILERQLPEEEEPLALLVSPNICIALRSISGDGITRKCLLASPWALTMRLSMQKLLDNKMQNEPYFKQLGERIRSEGLELMDELVSRTTKPAMKPLERIPRLVYHRDCYTSELIPVVSSSKGNL